VASSLGLDTKQIKYALRYENDIAEDIFIWSDFTKKPQTWNFHNNFQKQSLTIPLL
jgi:hypothetical protein